MSCVYFIRHGRRGPIKMGVADSPEQRLAQLQVGNPYELRLIGKRRVDAGWNEARRLEFALHEHFADEWIRGEWFKPSARLLEAITEMSDPPRVLIPPGPMSPILSEDERWEAMAERVRAAVSGV